MYPWKIVGCDEWTNETDEVCVRLYVERALQLDENHSGTGLETQRLYYKKKYVKYEPVIGHLIVASMGRYGISEIIVVGQV